MNDIFGGEGVDLHDARELLYFVLPREDGVPSVQLGQDAAKTPHVDGHVIRQAHDYFGGAVKARLDVGVYALVLETRGAKVDHL